MCIRTISQFFQLPWLVFYFSTQCRCIFWVASEWCTIIFFLGTERMNTVKSRRKCFCLWLVDIFSHASTHCVLYRIPWQVLQQQSKLPSEVTVFDKVLTGSCPLAGRLGPLSGKGCIKDQGFQWLGHQSRPSTPQPGTLWFLMREIAAYLISIHH